MARYLTEAEANTAGFTIVHEADRSRYALYGAIDQAKPGAETGTEGGSAETLLGEAHYRLLGDDAIDFDHTVVTPALRGTGLSGLLAHRAVTGSAAAGRTLTASCWFIAGYLKKHPELTGTSA